MSGWFFICLFIFCFDTSLDHHTLQTNSSSSPAQDALQENYNKEGKFPGPTIIPPRRLWTLLNFLFWATLLLSPLINFACGVAVSGSPLLIIGFIIFLIIGRLTVQRPPPPKKAFVLSLNRPRSLQYFFCSPHSLRSYPPPHRSHRGEENGFKLRQPGGQETKLKCVCVCVSDGPAVSHPYQTPSSSYC